MVQEGSLSSIKLLKLLNLKHTLVLVWLLRHTLPVEIMTHMTLFQGAWARGENYLLHCPLNVTADSRHWNLTGDPYAALSCMLNINRMPALYPSKRPSKNSFQTFIDLINQGTSCMSKESIWQIISPDFCLTFLLQRGISVMFCPTG